MTKANLTIDGKVTELPVREASVGPDVVDIRKFYGDTDKFTYDPGFTSTASCQSAITYIDGDAGVLLHRGYPIDQLAEQSSFMEVSYLLLHGDLPKAKELEEFVYTITRHTMVHEQLATFFRGFRRECPHAFGVISVDGRDHEYVARLPFRAARLFELDDVEPE